MATTCLLELPIGLFVLGLSGPVTLETIGSNVFILRLTRDERVGGPAMAKRTGGTRTLNFVGHLERGGFPPLYAPSATLGDMGFVIALSSIGLPLAMVIGAIAGWRIMKKGEKAKEEQQKNAWRDDSLDEWRRERDSAAEAERLSRVASPTGKTTTAGRGEEEAEPVRHQRIGG